MTQRFNPIFTATVTPASVSTRTDKNGGKYAISQGATIKTATGEPQTVTLMAFGKARDAVSRMLRKGRSVELRVQRDGGSVKVIGLPKAA